jgi:hypothetical protein
MRHGCPFTHEHLYFGVSSNPARIGYTGYRPSITVVNRLPVTRSPCRLSDVDFPAWDTAQGVDNVSVFFWFFTSHIHLS